MAYDPNGLNVLAYANGFTLWHYRSEADPWRHIVANGYFNAAAEMVCNGDIVVCHDASSRCGLRRMIVPPDGHGSIATADVT